MHRLLDRAHAIRSDAAIIPGHQHAPLGERCEHRVVHPELHRQFDLAIACVKADGLDIGFQLSQDPRVLIGIEPGHLEVRWQTDLQQVDLFVRWPESLGIGTAQRDHCGVKAVPDARVGVTDFQGLGVNGVDTFQVGQRRHVHDRHGRHAGCRHQVQQGAYLGGSVLGFLHRQRHEIEVCGIYIARPSRGQVARRLL